MITLADAADRRPQIAGEHRKRATTGSTSHRRRRQPVHAHDAANDDAADAGTADASSTDANGPDGCSCASSDAALVDGWRRCWRKRCYITGGEQSFPTKNQGQHQKYVIPLVGALYRLRAMLTPTRSEKAKSQGQVTAQGPRCRRSGGC